MKMRVKSFEQIQLLRPEEMPTFVGPMAEYCGTVLEFREAPYYHETGEIWFSDSLVGLTWRSDWLVPVNKITVNLHRGRKW